MNIEIVRSFSKKTHPGVVAHFRGLKPPWAKGRRIEIGKPAPKKLVVNVCGKGMRLDINVEAYRFLTHDEAIRSAGAAGLSFLSTAGSSSLGWQLDDCCSLTGFQQLLSGALSFSYKYSEYKRHAKRSQANIRLVIAAGSSAGAFRKELARMQAIYAGVNTARDLANCPAADLVPMDLAEHAKGICRKLKLTYKALSFAQLKKGKYAGITAVGQGSVHPPVMFTMTYKPAKLAKGVKPLCLVGKGVTFDSGGISIKGWDGMWDMKADMGGAAAVIGALEAIARLKLPIAVTGVVAAAENMPDGKSYRPGDVLRYKNGVSVEIRSTDAEGRLVLADALIYAQTVLKQKRIVDFATLTGACVRALGTQYIGLFSRSEAWASKVKKAADASGEQVWELPLHPEYRKMLESSIADIKNGGGALAGASTAGEFLDCFIQAGTEHVHLDIAGVFLAKAKGKHWSEAGATGAGVRLACCLAEQLSGGVNCGT